MILVIRKLSIGTILFLTSLSSYASSWQDLWQTPDQQAKALMKKNQFGAAQLLFKNPEWKAVAAYRNQHFPEAADGFKQIDNAEGYFNQGNALAHQSQYENAIAAYDKALKLNPHHADAIYNRALIQELLKKQQEQEQKKNKDQKQESRDKDKNKNKQQKEDQTQNKQDGSSSDSQDAKDKQPEESKKDDQSTQNKASSNQDSEKKPSQPSQDDSKQQENDQTNHSNENEEAKKNLETSEQKDAVSQLSKEQQESQQANEQWLRLIPDDPGGLLREKFLRDYIRKQKGWSE